MFPSKVLLSLVFASILFIVDARPLTRTTGKASLKIARRIDTAGALNVLEKDRARAQALQNPNHHLSKRSAPFSITNSGVTYTAQVGVGSPPTDYTLLIDTGSSNIWVGANKPYVATSTSQKTGNTVSVSYGSGNFSGVEWTDTVTLTSDLVITDQSIGVASVYKGFNGVDGIIGVGPTDLTSNTVTNMATIPTVTDNLLSQGTISEEVLGVYFVPASESDSHGSLTFGGIDYSAITSPVNYVPLTKTSPASTFWGIDSSILYGADTILPTTAGIVDTGTSLILIATNAFQAYQSATGGTNDNATGLLAITSAQYADLKPLTFLIGNIPYILLPDAQIWPRSLNSVIGGSSNGIYLIVNDLGTPSGKGLDFISGYAFLERFYSVFDTTNKRVGFATTEYTLSLAN